MREVSGMRYTDECAAAVEMYVNGTSDFSTMVRIINAARDAYVAGLPSRYRRDSETMDAGDLALLANSYAGLTTDDVARMFDKYEGNLGMQGAIVEENARRPDHASLTYYDEKTRENDAKTFAESMISAAREGGLRAAMAIDGRYIPVSLVNE